MKFKTLLKRIFEDFHFTGFIVGFNSFFWPKHCLQYFKMWYYANKNEIVNDDDDHNNNNHYNYDDDDNNSY